MKQWQKAALEAANAAHAVAIEAAMLSRSYREIARTESSDDPESPFMAWSDEQAACENIFDGVLTKLKQAQYRLGESEDIEVKEEG